MMQDESPSPNIRNYVEDYIRRALNDERVEEPDPTGDKNHDEVLICIYNAHRAGNKEAARQAWKKLVELKPELADLSLRVGKRKRFIHVSELATLPAIEWLIDGMLPKGSLCELHGAPGTGKSLLGLHLSAIVAEHSHVLYIAAEGILGYRNRVPAWEAAHGKPIKNLTLCQDAVNLLEVESVWGFINDARHFRSVLIVVDTLARCMIGGDENSAKDMGLAIQACDLIRTELNATVLLIHHTGKTGSSERGSSALRGACDAMIELVDQNGQIKVSCSKLKDGMPFEDHYYRMVEAEGSVALVPTSRSMDTVSHKLSRNELTVLEMLALEIFRDNGAKCARIKDHTNILGSTLDRTLESLKKRGYIAHSKKGEPYFITEEGRNVLAA